MSSTQTDFSRGGSYFPAKILVWGTDISRTNNPVTAPQSVERSLLCSAVGYQQHGFPYHRYLHGVHMNVIMWLNY